MDPVNPPDPSDPKAADQMMPKSEVRYFVHQIAAPLLVVTMISEMLLDDETLTPSQSADVRKIQEAGTELANMLKEFRAGLSGT